MKIYFLILTLSLAILKTSSLAPAKKISYTYTLWIGDAVDEKFSITLKSKKGIFFIDAMQQAAAKNSNFEFERTIHPLYGSFITKIAGYSNVESE